MKLFLHILFSFLTILIIVNCQNKEPKKLGTETMGEFAPPDAFLEGEKHPYYGSENEWNQRFFYEHADRFYKRRGQRAMLEIMKGNIDEAEVYCRNLLKDDPDDLESLFNLVTALVNQQKIIEAMEVLKESIKKATL